MANRIEHIQTRDFDGKVTQEVHAIVLCDGPKCQETGAACKGRLEWVESKPEDLPDDFYRIIRLSVGAEQKEYHFFSKECMRDAMREYTPPLSPREKSEIAANNAKIEAAKLAEGLPTETELQTAVNAANESGPVTQPDGFAGGAGTQEQP